MPKEDFVDVPISEEFAAKLRQRLADDPSDKVVKGWLIAAGQPFTKEQGMELLEFRKSSYCDNSGGSCVTYADRPDGVTLQDTKSRVVEYDLEEWRAFVAGVKNGEFDR